MCDDFRPAGALPPSGSWLVCCLPHLPRQLPPSPGRPTLWPFRMAALESCVSDTSELPEGTPVTEADLAQLTNLSCRSMGISDIGPLVFATGLTRIDLADNSVSDLRPVSGLSSLVTLLLVSNQVSDVTPLSGLPALSDLYLNRNQVSDITPLASIPTLRALLIHSNQISDVTALAGLSNLEIVYVANNAIRDISPLWCAPALADRGRDAPATPNR